MLFFVWVLVYDYDIIRYRFFNLSCRGSMLMTVFWHAFYCLFCVVLSVCSHLGLQSDSGFRIGVSMFLIPGLVFAFVFLGFGVGNRYCFVQTQVVFLGICTLSSAFCGKFLT